MVAVGAIVRVVGPSDVADTVVGWTYEENSVKRLVQSPHESLESLAPFLHGSEESHLPSS